MICQSEIIFVVQYIQVLDYALIADVSAGQSRGSESRHRCSLGSDTGCAGSRSVTGGLYVAAQNLFTITGYSGMDPEVGYGGYQNWVSGIDLGFYPSPRTYMVGANIKF